MAESENQKELTGTLIDGSEFLYDLYCQICEEEGRHVEAFGFCQTCSDFLCDDCFTNHCRPKPMRHHVLLDGDNMPRDMASVRKSVSTDKCTETCFKHVDKYIEYFCQSHQVLACSNCIIMEHRACGQLDHIPEVSEGIADSKELREMVTEIATMENKAKNIIQTSKDNIPLTERQALEANNSFKEIRKDVIYMLDNLEKSIKAETDNIKAEDNDKLKDVSIDCNNALLEIGSLSKRLTSLRNLNQNCNMYVALKNARVSLRSLNDCLEKAEYDKNITEYAFQLGRQLQDLLKTSDAPGRIVVTNPVRCSTVPTSKVVTETVALPNKPELTATDGKKPRQVLFSDKETGYKSDGLRKRVPVKVSKATIKENKEALVEHIADVGVKSYNDKDYCWITGSAVLTSHTLIVTDTKNEKVKVIDTKKHSLVFEIHLQSNPWDVTSVNSSQIAVTLPNIDKIQFLRMAKKGTLHTARKISVNGHCYGIAYAKGKFVVSFMSPGKVEILTLDGVVQHTIATDAAGQHLFTYPYYLAMGPDGDTIYVSDIDTGTVTSLTTTGNVLSVYRNDQLIRPYGIAVAAEDKILVCGNMSCNVHMLSARRCELIKVILKMEDVNVCPESISYCKENKELFVGMGRGSDTIKVYQLT